MPKALIWSGVPIVISSLILAARLVWEQTVWTLEQGPQMVGFSLMHGGLGILLVLALWGGLIWLGLVILFAAWRRTFGGVLGMSLVAAYAIAWALVATPYGFWQRMLVDELARGPWAAEFVQYAAAVGDLDTVKAFLNQGVSVDAKVRSGATPLHAAAVGGQLAVAEFLVSQGANVNAINRYGDSPLENAQSGNKVDVAKFLAGKGGKRIRGSEEQRDRVAGEIVREQMEESDRLIKGQRK